MVRKDGGNETEIVIRLMGEMKSNFIPRKKNEGISWAIRTNNTYCKEGRHRGERQKQLARVTFP